MAARRSYGSGSLEVRVVRGQEVWYARWRADGRQVKRRIGPKRKPGTTDGLTRTEAERELRRLIDDETTVATPRRGITVGQAGDIYLAHLKATGRKPSTIAAVRGHLKHWHAPFFGDRSMAAVTVDQVLDLVALMQAGRRPGELKREKPLSAKTIRNAMSTLSALYAFGMVPRRGWVKVNPVQALEMPAVTPDEDIRFLEPAEIEAVARNAQTGPYEALDRALYLTAAMTGLRIGELVALRWRDIDWTAGRVRVRQNHVLGEFGTPKSRRSTRSVPMADRVGAELDALAKGLGEPSPDALVFPDPVDGQPLRKAAVLRRFRLALGDAKLDTTHRVHDLRHSFGTRMAAAGVPMRTLQEWMGHRDIATTQRYADYAPSAHEAAFIAAAFGQDTAPRAQSRAHVERT